MNFTETDDLTTQARELVTKALYEKRVTLNRDQPWKLAAKRLLAGQDVRLGQLTEIFRALDIQPRMVTGVASLVMKTGERVMFHSLDEAVRMSTLLTKGEATVHGVVVRLTEQERKEFMTETPSGAAVPAN